MDAVLGTLASLGYDAEWSTLSACAVGAPHTRERVFIVAHSTGRHAERRTECNHQREWPDSESVGARFQCQSNYSGQTLAYRKSNVGFNTRVDVREVGGWWRTEPDVVRVAYGVSNGMERNKGLGNSVVPQVAELIGRSLIKFHASQFANAETACPSIPMSSESPS